MAQYNFKAIGTTWTIDFFDANAPIQEHLLLQQIQELIAQFDQVYSRFRSDSTISRIAQKAGVYEFSSDADQLFSTYYDLHQKTDGFFTPLIGQVLVDAGYDPTYSLEQKKQLQTPPRWEEVLEFKQSNVNKKSTLIVKQPVQLDFGAAGKGYLIDLVGAVLDTNHIKNYVINAGGDILHKGTDIVRIGLEDPHDTSKAVGICELNNKSIAGSSGNRRAWSTYTHIINPKTLVSPTNIAALWVVADTAFIADALTTCLFFVEPETLSADYSFEYCILYTDRSCRKSPGFTGELFVQ